MRETLQVQLTDLTDELGEMATRVATAMRDATTALLDRRPRLAELVISADAELDVRRDEISERAVEILALQQPVATDLRRVVAVIHVAADIERMGDLAAHVAQVVRRQPVGQDVPAEIRPLLEDMGRTAVALAVKAAEVVATRNVLLARELDGDDEVMDTLHRKMFEVLMAEDWPHGVAVAVDLTLLGRFYERYADHAVAMAKQTIFSVIGDGPDPLGA